MRRLHCNPVPRAVATALVLFAQLQLLWLAAVHCHELPLVPLSVKFQPINPAQKPASATADIQCPACNLIHQSITLVWPEFSASQPIAAERYRLSPAPVRARTGDLPVSRGRAPPLS
jgi:hypothetical protein